MAKKFGKFLLGAAVLGTAAAAAYVYLQKKGVLATPQESTDEDYDDFSEEEEETSCNYVSLTNETEIAEEEPIFTETTEEPAPIQKEPAEPDTVEEFFDEETTE